jgi:uncharacterized protein YecT (DUF1311 family)
MNKLILLFASIMLSSFAYVEEDDPCKKGSAAASIQCQEPRWKAAEKELQSTYNATLKELKEASPHLVKDLVEAQRTWIRFREQYCGVYGRSRVEGNPWTAFWEGECLAEEARSCTKALKQMIE